MSFRHERSYIQTTQTTHVTRPEILKINWTTEPSGWLSGLIDMRFSQILAIIWLLTPFMVGMLFLLRKRRWTFLKPFLISVFIGYGLIVVSAQISDAELKARLYELDTNGDGVFTNEEITPEVNRRLMAVANDTGRTLAPFTGLPISAIWSAINLGAFALCIRIVNSIKLKRPAMGAT